MPRPTWKGSISFGLVHIPVVLYPGEKRSDLSFRLLDSRNQARVRYERVNEVTGEEVPWDQIVKAYEYDDDNYVVLTDEDFENAAVEATRSVEIEDFVDLHAIELPYFDKPYVLEPLKQGEKGYVLLREALKQTSKAGIARVVIRTRQYLSALVVQDNALLLVLLRFSNELRNASEFNLPGEKLSDYKVTQKEVHMAQQLIDSMSTDWEPERYHDEYREALLAWIEEKAAADGQIVPPRGDAEPEKPAGEIINIADLLKQSVKERQRAGSGKETESDDAPAKKRSSTTKKTKAKAKSKPKPKKKAR